MLYVNVILPLPLQPTFTYTVPTALQATVARGQRVIVPFGSGRPKFYTGIIDSVSPIAPQGITWEVKDIVDLPDTDAVVRHPQIRLWQWMADYYLCSVGEVMNAALPAGLKIESETTVEVNPDWDAGATTLTEREAHILQTLDSKGKLKLAELGKATGRASGMTQVISRMVAKGAVIVSENLRSRIHARRVVCVRPAIKRGDDHALQQAYQAVHAAPRQEKALMTLIQLSGFTQVGHPLKQVTRTQLIERSGVTTQTVQALVQKGLAETYTVQASLFGFTGIVTGDLPKLSEAQNEALSAIHHSFSDHAVTLLHGVTSSGKTEIYIHLIDHILNTTSQQVLYLVPEIALTTQLTQRIQRVFGDKVLVYHSRFSDSQRVELWQRLLHSTEPLVVIGARSAVFLPFAKLGLVIVDEEHESSYKQHDPAPRYNARDAAIVLAGMHGARTLLGSATPSVETYHKATTGKFGLVTLSQRFGGDGVQLPEIRIVDLAQARRQNRMAAGGVFAADTLAMARRTLEGGGQTIFFHNRRGYAPMAECRLCGYTPRCQHCDVSLTWHRSARQLVCHYCGATYQMPTVCPQCQEPSMQLVGFGTERVEDGVTELFPGRRVLRMDLDSTRSVKGYAEIIDSFSRHEADILVGTQMVTKGLDFGDVRMVAVLSADTLINMPDFRAAERAFNMLEQVSGRAGRRAAAKAAKAAESADGAVVAVQTRQPDHPVIGFLKNHDYLGFFRHEIAERQQYVYPPFARIIYIYLRHRDEESVRNIATHYAEQLRALLGNRVYGPDEPWVSRVRNQYIRRIMLKIEPTASVARVRDVLRQAYIALMQDPTARGTTLYYDVDPV